MPSFRLIQPGDILYETRSVKRGNTTQSEKIAYRVRVVEVHGAYIIASWNSNAPEKMFHGRVSRMTRTPPKGTAERVRFDATVARAVEAAKALQA